MDSIDKINMILHERKISGAELSRSIGVSTGVFSQWNKKRTKPSVKNLCKVADVLGVPVERLMPDSDDREIKKEAPSEDEAKDDVRIQIEKKLNAADKDQLLKWLAMMELMEK